MSNNIKLAVVGKSKEYSNWIKDVEIVEDLDEADVLLFTGGEDVDPVFYKKSRHKYTSSNLERDVIEARIFKNALNNNKRFIGICRGSQFITVMAGGELYQHVTGHNVGDHNIILREGAILPITSTHHQMMNPFGLENHEYDMLGWSEERRSDAYYLDQYASVHQTQGNIEPEIVYYKNINAVAIQGHPEMMNKNCMTNNVLNTILKECGITK